MVQKQTQNQEQMNKIIKEIQKIEDKLQTILEEVDNLKINNIDELDEFKEVYDYAASLYELVLKVNEKIFNEYWEAREKIIVGIVPSDVSEDVENTYVDKFIDFITDLHDYNLKQLYNYIKGLDEEEEKRE